MNGRVGRRSVAAAGGLALLVLAGCGGGDEGSAKPTASAAPAAVEEVVDPAVQEVRSTMLGAITVGSPAAPVDLRYDLKSVPIQGRPFDLEFAVLPDATIVTLRGTLDGSREGIEIAAPAGPVTLEKLQAGTVHRFGATIVPRSVGAHVLNVELQIELPTGPAKRTFSIPLVVQTPAAAAAAASAAEAEAGG